MSKKITASSVCENTMNHISFNWRVPKYGPVVMPIEDLQIANNSLEPPRIVVVVAETPDWWEATPTGPEHKFKKLETGRAMAQGGHAVSKLKLSYALALSEANHNLARTYLQMVHDTPITTIYVKARDTRELIHITGIACNRNLHWVEFQDENPAFYNSLIHPITAVAIGPYPSEFFAGLTDYLPLWKSPDEL